MKFDRYTVIALICALPYLVFGVALCRPGAVSIVSFLVLTAAITGAEVACNDMLFGSRRKSWLYRIPFSALFLLVQFVLGWNVMIPFYVMGQLAVGGAATLDRFEHMPKRRAAKPLIVSVAASVLFVTVCLITGVKA